MRPGQNKRMRGRNNNRKGPNPLTRTYESNGPDVKIRGTPHHVAEKYLQLARDAQSSGDPVMAESYLQHAEHYFRLIAAAQEAQMQSQPGYIRPPGEAEFDESDEEDDVLQDRFASMSDRFSQPAPYASAPQPFANQPPPYAERPYGDRPQPQQQDRQPGRFNQDRGPDRMNGQDRNGQDRNGQDRNGPDRNGQDRNNDRGPRPDRPYQDRNGQGRPNRNGYESRRDYRDQPPRDNRGNEPRSEMRGDYPRQEQRYGADPRDAQPEVPVDEGSALPAFIRAPVRLPAPEAEQQVEAAQVEPISTPVEEEQTGEFPLRPRRRRRGRPPLRGNGDESGESSVPGELPLND